MTTAPTMTVADIAALCGGRMLGDAAMAGRVLRGVATLAHADESSVSWVTDAKHADALAKTRAGAVLGKADVLGDDPRGIVVADPEEAIAQVLERFTIPLVRPAPGVHPSAVVGEGVVLGPGVAVGACVVIGPGARIGDGTVIHDGVSLGAGVKLGRDCVVHPRCVVYDRCEIGDRVILHGGVVVGADGFGYIFRKGAHRKVPQIGIVVIEDDVEIGANSCIDRAKVGATRIGRGTKIDNLVQVAHNVETGPACILVSQCGIAGSTRLGQGVVLGGQVGLVHGLTVGDGVRVGAQAGVMGDIPAGQTWVGSPAREHRAFFRDEARMRRLASLMEQVAELKQRVESLERTTDDRTPR